MSFGSWERGVDLPPPPRRVRGGPGAAVWFGRVFVLPHTLVGIGGLCAVAMMVLWSLFGAETTATVTGARTGSSKGRTTYTIEYRYDGATPGLTDSSFVSASVYQALARPPGAAPAEVRVNHYELGPVHLSKLTSEGTPLGSLAAVSLFAGFWNAIMGAVLYGLWVVPYRNKQLVMLGTATSGNVKSKRTRRGKGVTYHVAYTYETASGERLEGEVTTSSDAWEAAKEDAPLTVLYWPEKPARSMAYELGDYRVEEAGR